MVCSNLPRIYNGLNKIANIVQVKFLPANIIHLQLINPNSSVQIQLPDNNFAHPLGEIQNKFKETYHAELHAAVTIYVATLCLEGIALIVALVSFFLVDVVWIFGGFSIVCILSSPFSSLELPIRGLGFTLH